MGNGSSMQRTIPIDGSSTSSLTGITSTSAAAKTNFHETYSLSKDLGSGAFSVVKLAIHKSSGKNTAVKIIAKKKLSEEDLAALMSEISILCELDHPHIIKCYETFDEGNEFYIVTELVAGGELFDRIVAKTHYTEKEARDLVKMFLETMAYMHEAGVVHRDLKPENLLLCSDTDDADIKVADFGFAKKTSDLLPNETACGTPGYVAPEILRGDPYGTEVDIWSMGVICYVLLAGYPPFYDEDQKKLFRKIKEGKYHFHQDYWSNTSPAAMDMIRKMLCVNQEERWSARRLLSHAWITAGDEELLAKDLSKSIEAMKKFKAKMRFKAVAKAIMATKRMQNAFKMKVMSGTSSICSLPSASDLDNQANDESNISSSSPIAGPTSTDGVGQSAVIDLSNSMRVIDNQIRMTNVEQKGNSTRVIASSISLPIEAVVSVSGPIKAVPVETSSTNKSSKVKNKNQIKVHVDTPGDLIGEDESYLTACID